jgi:hypothetical protein
VKKWILWILGIKIAVSFLYCFVGFVHPHIIRQTVTLAVNQRFLIDWKFHDKVYPLLPRSLAGGDHDALLEMEFPLLNYLTMPAFLLETESARTTARILCLLLFLAAWFYNYRTWKDLRILGISCKIPSLILIILPISGTYLQRFMPDFFSFILCSIALGKSLQTPNQLLIPLIFASFGLLEKPTAIVAFGPLLLLPTPWKAIRERLHWLLPSGLLMLGFYTFGTKWIRSLSDLDRYYLTDFRNPIESVFGFLAQPVDVLILLVEQITTPYLPVVVFCIWIFERLKLRERYEINWTSVKLWSLLFLQVTAIAALDGPHSLIHRYYFVGLSFTSALLWTHYFNLYEVGGLSRKAHRLGLTFLAAGLVLFNVEHSFYELREGVKPTPLSVQTMWASCKQLKVKHPEWPWGKGYSFRSKLDPISDIGLCFGEIQGSEKSAYGFFSDGEPIPSDCHAIDEAGPIRLVECIAESEINATKAPEE